MLRKHATDHSHHLPSAPDALTAFESGGSWELLADFFCVACFLMFDCFLFVCFCFFMPKETQQQSFFFFFCIG